MAERQLTTARKILINSLIIMLSEIEIHRKYSDLNLCVFVCVCVCVCLMCMCVCLCSCVLHFCVCCLCVCVCVHVCKDVMF